MRRLIKFIYEFFYWFGTDNDYMYPTTDNEKKLAHLFPYPKKHWWKTRIGFKTACDLAKYISKI